MIDTIEKNDVDIDQSPFEIEALAARYKAERDLAIQQRDRLEKEVGLLRGAEHERDMLRDLADVLVVKVIEHPTGRTFAEGLDDAEIDDCIDSIIEAIDRRLMPPGMEWPRYEDGEPVLIADEADSLRVDEVRFGVRGLGSCTIFQVGPDGLNERVRPVDLGERLKRSDSWERLEEDATKQPNAYCVEHGLDDDSLPTNEKFARDLVRRAKALAERGA